MSSISVSEHFSPAWVGISALASLGCYLLGGWLLSMSRTYRLWNRGAQYQARATIPSYCFILFIVPLSLYVLATDKELASARIVGSTWLSRVVIHAAAGYFLFDSLSVLLHMGQQGHGAQYLLHGVLCLVTYAVAAVYDCYHYWGPTFLLFEFTTLFINTRWWLAQTDMKQSRFYLVNGILLIIAWFFVRVLFGLSQSFIFWQDALSLSPQASSLPWPIRWWYATSNISLNALNIFWFLMITKSAMSWGRVKNKNKAK
mmetsp:Transcript_18805/g.36585  ORF Transcript_18805/g.36585 Transcript_18805/m.36585 type:complete len:258 (-) Transcript_18805:229-1002(-)|eukprot:CAMPEP_0173394232 /NCGR_PEP_ID=MMETSP1356-20130122/25863_1 /TAXON_ID=77927 ORGANISM="Hemiselmis virescens, Strain PCC157" /NCGR_SAMPLE_ID=MMETSP1356 /ASSEMBLY_ACC=CAM_ASM_000847 /LENGTH=257 /DNA_ID=CAMNT_0014352485 /DNA_START=115 /DNA_END=888 /DNA_ORIENTATION=+